MDDGGRYGGPESATAYLGQHVNQVTGAEFGADPRVSGAGAAGRAPLVHGRRPSSVQLEALARDQGAPSTGYEAAASAQSGDDDRRRCSAPLLFAFHER